MSGYRFDRLKILVADDNPHMRALLSTVLQAFGVKTVYEVSSGEESWETLLAHPCDICVVDWMMNGMSGLELTRKIRTAPDSPNPFLPVVMLTGHSNTERVCAARDAGVNEFLAKPVSAKSLLARLQSVIERPRPFVRTHVYFGPCRRRRRDSSYAGPERRAGEDGLSDIESYAPGPAA